MNIFDIIVIGGGPGGYVAAIKGAQEGKKVCLIEQNQLGGVCLNWGCIPTKALIKSIEVFEQLQRSEEFGIVGMEQGGARIDMKKLQARKNKIIKNLTGGVGSLLKSNGVTVVQGKAEILGPHTVRVNYEDFRAQAIIIATGSTPIQLPISITGNRVIISDEALDLTDLPKEMVVIGGGVIGVEFAYIFAKLGIKVTILEMAPQIISMMDASIIEAVAKELEKIGIVIYKEAQVLEIKEDQVFFNYQGKVLTCKAEKILMAVGRTPCTEGLGLEVLNIEMERRAIRTTSRLQTSIPSIYAIGDVNGKSMLAHTASAEGIIAIENILGKEAEMRYDRIPSCIYIHPEIASVGLTEAEAIKKYGTVKTGIFPMAANGKAMIEGETQGWVKVILENQYQEILGVHICGPHATDMIAEIVVAMNLEGTGKEVAASIHPHPTMSESVAEGFHQALGRAIHI